MTSDALIGRELANVRIERLIGQGEMGQVFAGVDVKLQRPVAVKIIDTLHGGNASLAQRFINSAQIIAAWRHEHIVRIYHAGQDDWLFYLAMEYIDGQDLAGLIAEYHRAGMLLPHEHVLTIGRAIAGALDYAHERGVVHRDVKPANVLISVDDRIVLTDFGLALDQRLGSAGMVFVSSQYIAPEQAQRSSEAVPQSDLYSLAVMLYEMLVGELPFHDRSPMGVALQHMTQPPPAPRQVNPDLSRETEAVLLKALSKAAEERFQSGAALLQALQEALQTTPSQSLHEAPATAAERRRPLSEGQDHDPLLGADLDVYHLESLLGKGGMARIYRGQDTRLQRRVAIKVIDLPYQHDPDYIERFEREARAIAQLEHPNIVHLYYYGEARSVLYMVMQYIEGRDLHAVLAEQRQRGARLSPQDMLLITRNLCFALDYAHSKGVIHRDVHPGNILIDGRGRAILTDFGLALVTAVGTRGEIFGTPEYVAPEQAMSSAYATGQSDLYALGVILYEIVAGQVPFKTANPLDTALLHISQPPRPLRELAPDVSPALEAVIMKALAKEPGDRYASGAELAAAMARALDAA